MVAILSWPQRVLTLITRGTFILQKTITSLQLNWETSASNDVIFILLTYGDALKYIQRLYILRHHPEQCMGITPPISNLKVMKMWSSLSTLCAIKRETSQFIDL